MRTTTNTNATTMFSTFATTITVAPATTSIALLLRLITLR
jgi:hypothetical protein